MHNPQKVKVIGIGPNGECFWKNFIENADILAGGKRLLNFFIDIHSEKIVLDKNIREKLNKLNQIKNKKIVILASGDPLFFGVGKLIISIFGGNKVEFYPYFNSVQMLCAKAGVNYENFIFLSIHGREISEKVVGTIKYNKNIAVLTDKKNNINKLAEKLLNYLKKDTKIILGQMIGTEHENILDTTLNELKKIQPSDLDTVLIFNENPYTIKTGISDNEFMHSANLITKKEIRVISLSFLELQKDSILWDIGAGSGSVSIEAGNICYEGKIYAIEKNEERITQINENIKKFKSHNINVIQGFVPEVLTKIEKPDRVFVGGFNGNILELLDYLVSLNIPIIVLNIVSIEKLNSFINFATERNLQYQVSSVLCGNLTPIASNHYFKSQNQVYICKLINKLPLCFFHYV